jgi:serine/threonine-protein kinase HipA
MKRNAKPDTAVVLRGDTVAGHLRRTPHGAVFEYEPSLRDAPRPPWEDGIAYRLPYETARVETLGTNLHPFFAGLLPEGLRLEALVRRVKTSRDDLLSLLVEAGTDCIGDLSVVRDVDAPRETTTAVDTTELSTLRFAELLAESLAGKRGLEPTLPGVQEKVSAAMISVPLRAKHGSGAYILKLNPPRMPRLVENEHFFLQMARASGLEVARAELVHDRDGAAGLLVERFDRARAKGGGVSKIHQEDACQFLDRYPADKYLLSHADLARAIGELASAPIVELARYVRLVAFSYLVANGDLHAKNVSLHTLPEDGRIELTPAYDVLSSLPYGDRSMALSFDGRDDNLKRAGFVAFGERHGVRRAATEAILDELTDVAPAWIARLDEIDLEPRKTADLRRVMTKRRADLASKGTA